MTKDEFLLNRTRDAIAVYEEYGCHMPTFAILFKDGTTATFGTQFDGQQSKEAFEYLMRKICSDPKVIACTFTSDGWLSIKSEEENKPPSECDDKEEVVTFIYNTRDNKQEMHVYKPNKNGKLDRLYFTSTPQGRFSNPFLVPCLTNAEKEKASDTFQQDICNSLCQFYKEYQEMTNVLLFLTDTQEQIIVSQLTDEELLNKTWLRQMIRSQCQKPQTLAFILAYPKNDLVNVIFVSELREEVFSYRIDPSSSILTLKSREPYKGEFAGFIKEVKILFCASTQNDSLLN